MLNKIKKNELEKQRDKKEWTIENVQSVWDEYRNNHQSASIQTALKNTILSIEEETIKAIVPSELIMEKIMSELALKTLLREQFTDNLSIIFDVKKDLFPDYQTIPAKRYLTSEDKFQALIDKNPNLDLLIKKLDLSVTEK